MNYIKNITLISIASLVFMLSMAYANDIKQNRNDYNDHKVFGRVHFDYSSYIDDKFDHVSIPNFRRARVGVKGKLSDNVSYKIEIDFAEENLSLKNAYLSIRQNEHALLKFGNFKPFLGLENNTSSNYIQFTECSLASNAFARDEELGAGYLLNGKRWTLSSGVFFGKVENISVDGNAKPSFDIRGSYTPIKNENGLLHLGLGYSVRNKPEVKYKAKISGAGFNLINTGKIMSVGNVQVFAIELAGIYKKFTFSSEGLLSNVRRKNDLKDVSFDGYNAQVSYFLTDDKSKYSFKKGNFIRVKPNNVFNMANAGKGAVEVLLRYEHLNLNDISANIKGGELNNLTVGMNWYFNNHTRVMLNYINVSSDKYAVVSNDNPQLVNFRLQWDF